MQPLAKTETMVVKNTFLEISESASLWSRQMSEPAKKVSCWDRQISYQSQATVSEWDEWDDEHTSGSWSTRQETAKSGAESQSSSDYRNEAHGLCGVPHGAARAYTEQLPVKVPTPQPQLGGSPAGLSAHTVTMRGVPAEYTKQAVMGELQDAGFRHGRDFDFLYVPSVPRRSSDGHTTNCFVNFTSATVMNSFCSAFDGRIMRKFNGTKPVQVTITTPEDLMLLAGSLGSAPGARSPIAAVPQAPAAAWPQGIPAAPAAVARPMQISLQEAWGQHGAQPQSPPPAAPTWHSDPRRNQQPAAAPPVVFCPRCGIKGQGNFNFCSQCGFCVEGMRQPGFAALGTGGRFAAQGTGR